MSGVDIPDEYTITIRGGADFDLDNVRIEHIPNITLDASIKSLPQINAAITSIPTIETRSELAITRLPPLDVDIGIKPTRVMMPMNTHLCVSIFGINVLKIALCGENMLITEPYKPRKGERDTCL